MQSDDNLLLIQFCHGILSVAPAFLFLPLTLSTRSALLPTCWQLTCSASVEYGPIVQKSLSMPPPRSQRPIRNTTMYGAEINKCGVPLQDGQQLLLWHESWLLWVDSPVQLTDGFESTSISRKRSINPAFSTRWRSCINSFATQTAAVLRT